MITWISKALCAGAICLALASCDDFASTGGAAPGSGLPFAQLARGAVTIVPPVGYCVDKRSLRARFALMARCDTLGGTATFGAPLALITAAAVAPGDSASVSGPEDETILDRRQGQTLTLLQVKGKPPSAEMRDVYWRAIGQVGGQVVGLAIYEPADGAALGERAPDLLAQTMRRTRAQTAAEAVKAQDNSATTQAKPVVN
ncbi:hypothetical protein [uncultured Tateyamaria sp.]|uniref:hypothetical protein n=1 Tax=uncultured Tateyamaria sp. TaxID=455651 RepID=UPI002622F359|nr:hypothetical protein [uncultured Tateyamaria sp.]